MPKQNTDNLFRLVKSMSKSEKRNFTLYSRRNSSGENPLFIKLFNEIDRQNSYQEERLIEKVDGITKRQFANVKSNLYKQLLASLRLLYRTQNLSINIREQLDYAEILYAKGLYTQSLAILDKAKTRALGSNMHSLAMDIVSFEKMIESQHITRSMRSRVQEMVNTSADLAGLVGRESVFSNLSLQLYSLYLRRGYARNEEDYQYAVHFFQDHLPAFEEDQLSFFEKMYLYQAYVWIYNITQEFPKQYRYAQKWVDLFRDEPAMISPNIPLYLKSLHNLLNTLFLTLQYERFENVLQELTSFDLERKYQLNLNERSLCILFTYIHKINFHYLTGTFSEGLVWVGQLLDIIRENVYNWDGHRMMVFYYKIACLYFGAGQNEKAIEYLNRIINQSNPNYGEDIQCFARILNSIAHFELGNALLVAYQLKSVYRFLSRMEELNDMHRAILRFLKRTQKVDPQRLTTEFQKLKEELQELQTHPFERRSLLYLDIISWLDSKIQNRPVEDVIRENYLRKTGM